MSPTHDDDERGERGESLLADLPVGVFRTDAAGRLTYVNSCWEAVIGFSRDSLSVETWQTAIHPSDRAATNSALREAFRLGAPFRHQTRIVAESGAIRWLEIRGNPVHGRDGAVSGFVGIVEDVTELHERWLLEERERVAMDLHDGVLQSLYSIALRLRACRRLMGLTAADLGDSLRQVELQVAHAIRSVRSVLDTDCVDHSDEPPLADAMRALADDLRAVGRIETGLDIDPAVAGLLQAEAAAQLVYVAREATSNIARHADATSAKIRLAREANSICLEITDTGRGFSAQGRRRRSGFGMETMARRVAKVGGRIAIDSAPGAGTTVRVVVPIGQVRSSQRGA